MCSGESGYSTLFYNMNTLSHNLRDVNYFFHNCKKHPVVETAHPCATSTTGCFFLATNDYLMNAICTKLTFMLEA